MLNDMQPVYTGLQGSTHEKEWQWDRLWTLGSKKNEKTHGENQWIWKKLNEQKTTHTCSFRQEKICSAHPQNEQNQLKIHFRYRKISCKFMRHRSLKKFLWPSLRTHLSQQMTHKDLRNFQTNANNCKDTLP